MNLTSSPQSEVATNPEQMRDIFQKYLQPLDKKTYQILGCRIFQTRHQDARYMVQYVLRLAEANTVRKLRQQWVTGLMYSEGRTRQIWEDLRNSDSNSRLTKMSPAFAPSYYIPDLDMLVQVFPYDSRLPALPLLMVGPPAELEPFVLDLFGPGDWQVESWEAEPVRYLAEMRVTLRVTVQARESITDQTEEKCFYVKVYHDEKKGERTYEALRSMWEKASVGAEVFTVGRPIAYLSGLGILMQEEVTGTSLQEMLYRGDEVTLAVRKVAKALAALHLDPALPPWRRPLQREVAILERMRKLLIAACSHLKLEIEEIVGTVVASLQEVSPVPAHCDFLPAHIVFDAERLVLIDLDEFAGADPMLDVARLLSHLVNAPLRYQLQDRDRAWVAAQAFVEEYFAHAPEAWRSRLPLHYTIAVLKTASGFARRQTPGSDVKIETLLNEAKKSLAGKVW